MKTFLYKLNIERVFMKHVYSQRLVVGSPYDFLYGTRKRIFIASFLLSARTTSIKHYYSRPQFSFIIRFCSSKITHSFRNGLTAFS